MQPLKSRLQQEAQGGWEGLPSPQAPQSLHCQASAWEQSSSLPLCRLLHAYQAVAHSWHSKTQIHSWSLWGQPERRRRAESTRNQAAVLAPSLTDLASLTGLPRGKGSPTQPLSAITSRGICMKLKQGLQVQHLTSTPAASVSQLPAGEGATPQPGLPRSWSEGIREIA